MNIALVVPGGVDRTGEYRVIPALLALIKRLSVCHTVHVFALTQEKAPGEWMLAGAHIHNIGKGNTRWRALRALLSENRKGRFDVVQSVWAGPCGFIAVAAGQLLHIPSLVHVAGGELVALRDIGYGGRLTWRGRLHEGLVLRAATAVTAASEPIIDSLSRLGVFAQRLPLGVDLSAWPPRLPVRRRPDEPARLIHAASLNLVKDQRTLLQALARLTQRGVEFHMDIVGEDTLGGEIQAFACHLGLTSRVTFHGFLTQQRLRPLMDAAHLMVMSSRHEAGPLALLEAGVAGVPTVGTAVGHIAEWTPEAARSVEPGDWVGLAGEIGALLSDEELRLRVAREAHQRAVCENADVTAAGFELLYAQVVG